MNKERAYNYKLKDYLIITQIVIAKVSKHPMMILLRMKKLLLIQKLKLVN